MTTLGDFSATALDAALAATNREITTDGEDDDSEGYQENLDGITTDDDDYNSDGYQENFDGIGSDEDEPRRTQEEEEWLRRGYEASQRDRAMFEDWRAQMKKKEYVLNVQKFVMLARVYITSLEEHSSEC